MGGTPPAVKAAGGRSRSDPQIDMDSLGFLKPEKYRK